MTPCTQVCSCPVLAMIRRSVGTWPRNARPAASSAEPAAPLETWTCPIEQFVRQIIPYADSLPWAKLHPFSPNVTPAP